MKVALFLAQTPAAVMQALFPAPMYEMPNDIFFEVTGVLQVMPTVAAARHLARLARSRPRGPGNASHAGTTDATTPLFQ